MSAAFHHERLPRARHHLGTVVLLWAIQALAGLMLSMPWVTALDTWWGAHPDGDAALWVHGLPDVLELVTTLGPALRASAASTLVGLACWYVLSPLGTGVVLAALRHRPEVPPLDVEAEPAPPGAVSRIEAAFCIGFRSWSRLALLELVRLAAWIVWIMVAFSIPTYAVWASREAPTMTARSTITILATMALLAGGAAIEILADVTRASVVSSDAGLGRAFERVKARWWLVILRQAPRVVPRWLASVGLLGLGAWVTSRWPALGSLVLVHQLASLSRVGLRVSVLARASWCASELTAPPGASSRFDEVA